MQNTSTDLLTEVAEYYSEKFRQFGDTPHGVDWNSATSQQLRFAELMRVAAGAETYSLNDLGCGYGALFDYLNRAKRQVSYAGFDISPEMIAAGRARHSGSADVRFVCASAPDAVADFSVASGIFNVRQGRSDAEWQAYLEATLDMLNRYSRKGFSFNCLTSWSDADRMRDDLYYADPARLFEHCKRHYARNVALLHDYTLYEFTILVRKT